MHVKRDAAETEKTASQSELPDPACASVSGKLRAPQPCAPQKYRQRPLHRRSHPPRARTLCSEGALHGAPASSPPASHRAIPHPSTGAPAHPHNRMEHLACPGAPTRRPAGPGQPLEVAVRTNPIGPSRASQESQLAFHRPTLNRQDGEKITRIGPARAAPMRVGLCDHSLSLQHHVRQPLHMHQRLRASSQNTVTPLAAHAPFRAVTHARTMQPPRPSAFTRTTPHGHALGSQTRVPGSMVQLVGRTWPLGAR